ncbi:unnamed protein product [Trifolium pratense]|uniref:Uncharacterized protein n=1 Tax=Trifolium pratense TaxID=57577 RepID=A0ACB0JYE3_TRIPR|nr:unnamed protein product [Trifolium pratense]
MGRENHHHQHPLHYFHHQNLHIHHKATFLPMLCSRSIKDVSLPQCKNNLRSFSNDPLSPRISCTGQVKHKISFIPKSNTFSMLSPIGKYSMLKKLFSSKNLNTAATTATTPSSCGIRPSRVSVNSGDLCRKYYNQKGHGNNEKIVPISIENMDPPLPVIKRVRKLENENQVDSLWKRRSGGEAGLKSLELHQIHQRRHQFQLTSV